MHCFHDQTFRSKKLKRLWVKGDQSAVSKDWLAKIVLVLSRLEAASRPSEVGIGMNFHALKGFDPTRYAVSVSANWRITFAFDKDGNVIDVDLEDYHGK